MLERLADLIRAAAGLAARSPPIRARRPKGATGDGGFKATPDMMSILGCSADELGQRAEGAGLLGRAPARSAAAAAQQIVAGRAGGGTGASPTVAAAARAGSAPDRAPRRRHLDRRQPEPVARAPVDINADGRRTGRRRGGRSDRGAPAAGRRQAEAAEQWEEVWRPRRKGRAFEAGPGAAQAAAASATSRCAQSAASAPAAEPTSAPEAQRPSQRAAAGQGERPRRPERPPRAVPGEPRSDERPRVPCTLRRPRRKRRPSIPIRRSRR